MNQKNRLFILLQGEQAKSEALLLNILPKDIAAILKNENRTIADHYTCEPRGTVNVKGKGEMEVWLVLSAK